MPIENIIVYDLIDNAIVNEEVVAFNYATQAPDDANYWTLRVFSPWEVQGESVIGFDHTKDETRRFRFDRMGTWRQAEAEGEEYVRPE